VVLVLNGENRVVARLGDSDPTYLRTARRLGDQAPGVTNWTLPDSFRTNVPGGVYQTLTQKRQNRCS
jgi:hypothetical protein